MGKKQGTVICNTDGENKVSKIFIVSLRLIWCAGKEPGLSQAKGSTATKISVSKSEKLNLPWLFEIVSCKIQTVLQVYVTVASFAAVFRLVLPHNEPKNGCEGG